MQSHVTMSACFHVVHERPTETLKELQTRVVCANVEINVVACWRHIAVDKCLRVVVVSMGVNVDLFLLVVVHSISVERPHTTLLETEVVDAKISLCFWVAER